MTFLRKSTKQGTATTSLAKSALPTSTPVTGDPASPDIEAIVKAVIAAMSAKPTTTLAVSKPTAKPSKPSKPTLVKATPTAKPSKGKGKATTAKPNGKHPMVPKFADCCAVSLGADKSTLVDFDNAALVASALRANHTDREWTGIGGLKTAVRQLLRANGTLSPDTLNTAWKAVRTEARKQGFSA